MPSGLPVGFFNVLVTVLTAFVISVSIKIVGALLVSALLIIPVATSLVLAKGFRQGILLAVIISEIAVVGGLILSGVWNLAPGATIVLLSILLLLAAFGLKRRTNI